MRTILFNFFAMFFVITLAVVGIYLIYNAIRSHMRRGLEDALMRLGWEQDECDLWRHKRTGIVASFQDAIVRELRVNKSLMRIFGDRYFKEPY